MPSEQKKVKIVEVRPIMTDEEFKSKHEGTHFDEKAIKQLIKEDADIYAIEKDKDGKEQRRLIGKFRKNVFSPKLVQDGWDGFRTLAMPGRNRGAAAGPINMKGVYWKKRKPVETDKWATRYYEKGKISKMRVNNLVASGVLGFYEETPFMKAACRMTSYTRRYLHLFFHGLPFIQAIDAQFKKLTPDAHALQINAIKKHPNYRIPGTAFSTLTVNLNFRTAVHKDAGDFEQGFGNLSVIEYGQYQGGYTLFPRFGVAFDVRTGDFLGMDVHEWHCNTPMYETDADKAHNMRLPDIRMRDPTTGVLGSDVRFQRLTFVCYFRTRLQGCDEEETLEYYARQNFDEEAEMEKARSKPVKTLLLPQYNDIKAVEQSAANFGKTYRQRIPEGATRKLKSFWKNNKTKRRIRH